MKIKDSRKGAVKFGDVNCGTVFKSGDSCYIKIERFYTDNNDPVNYAELEYGSIGFFSDTALVEVLDCELVIK